MLTQVFLLSVIPVQTGIGNFEPDRVRFADRERIIGTHKLQELEENSLL
jgi:hypothetical protein